MLHRFVETPCHVSQALAFWAKKVGYHLTVALTITLRLQLRYDSQHLWRSTVRSIPHQTVTFYTLLIEGILVLSIRVGRIEILIWDPRFLGNIWSARNSKTFEVYLSVRPSVVITIASERKELPTLNFANRIGKWAITVHRIWYLWYHINQTGIPGSWAHRKSDSHQLVATLNNTTKNYPYRSIGSGTSHSRQIGIPGSWAHGKSDSQQIWY